LASREVIPLVQGFVENLPKPNGFTNKPTRGARCPTWRGTSPRYSMKLHTLPLGGSLEPRNHPILRLSYYNYSTLTSPTCMKLTSRRSRQARNWKGQEQHQELRGNVYFKQESKMLKGKMFSNY
jgi:hypothetical protein